MRRKHREHHIGQSDKDLLRRPHNEVHGPHLGHFLYREKSRYQPIVALRRQLEDKCSNENPTRVFPVFTPVVRFQVDKCLMGFYKRQFPCEACYGHYPPSRDDEERGKTIENVCFRCYPESQYNCEEEHQGSSSGKRWLPLHVE